MHFSSIICSAFCGVVGVNAFPPHHHGWGGGLVPEGHEYQPPGPFDSRSPCPGLNAMANHGFLPRSGLDISYDEINTATQQAFNFAPDVFISVFLLANETYKLSTTGNPLTINVRDLARHNTIEVDGSMTRNDLYFGDDVHFDATVFVGVAASLGLDGYSSDDAYVTIETAAKMHVAREELAMSVNPAFNASEDQIQGTLGTTGLFLTTMWDNKAKGAPKEWVKVFLGCDRIPYEQGYKAPKVKTGKFLGNMVEAVANASASV